MAAPSKSDWGSRAHFGERSREKLWFALRLHDPAMVDEPGDCVYTRRMPRIQVYLPDELHREVKRSGLSPSELLQGAVRSELQRRQQIARLDEYLAELQEEVGKPTRTEKVRADAVVRRMTRRRTARRAS